jgi:hypothetical protein
MFISKSVAAAAANASAPRKSLRKDVSCGDDGIDMRAVVLVMEVDCPI